MDRERHMLCKGYPPNWPLCWVCERPVIDEDARVERDDGRVAHLDCLAQDGES
jgi:hypothetical protein